VLELLIRRYNPRRSIAISAGDVSKSLGHSNLKTYLRLDKVTNTALSHDWDSYSIDDLWHSHFLLQCDRVAVSPL
jgi:hypothetical protein